MIDKLVKTFGLLGFSVLILCSLIHFLLLLGFILSGFKDWDYPTVMAKVDFWTVFIMVFSYMGNKKE
jgi:hypothetical protein